jgi:hypothetical protein
MKHAIPAPGMPAIVAIPAILQFAIALELPTNSRNSNNSRVLLLV